MKEIKVTSLTNIINNIDDDILNETLTLREKYVKKQKRKKYINLKAWVAIAACIAICLSIYPFLRYKLNDITEKQIGIWSLSSADNLKTLTRETKSGTKIEFQIEANSNINYYNNNTTGESKTIDPCLVLFAEWYTSIITFDYDTHFKLFPEKVVEQKYKNKVLNSDYDFDQSIDRITEVATKVIGFNKAKLTYNLESFTYLNSSNKNFNGQIRQSKDLFESAGIDTRKIEAISTYNFSKLTFVFNDKFVSELPEGTIRVFRFYFYENRWHLWPDMIEVDNSVRLATASEHTFLTSSLMTGKIKTIEDEYIELDTFPEARFFVKNKVNFEVGKEVGVYFYNFYVPAKTLDGEKTNLYSAEVIKPIEQLQENGTD